MNFNSTTRPRLGLRWVLGVGLVFVVVSAMALQAARSRAGERWREVVAHWQAGLQSYDVMWPGYWTLNPITYGPTYPDDTYQTGNIFRGRRMARWTSDRTLVTLLQNRRFFGSMVVARISATRQEDVDAIRVVFDEIGIELIVEDWP